MALLEAELCCQVWTQGVLGQTRQLLMQICSCVSYQARGAAATGEGAVLLQVVHSRALAVPGPEGIVVPMLVPLIDMVNHGGMQTRMLPSDPAEPQHNVRHDPAPHCMDACWCY